MKYILLLTTLFLALSCSRHESIDEEDQLRRIQTQIDRKEYSDAERDLQAILSHEPSNQRARVILASLYVSKAGITLKEYFALEKLSRLEEKPKKDVVDLKEVQKLDVVPNTDFGKALQFLAQVNVVAARFQEISEKFEQIPVVSDAGAENLLLALEELDKIENMESGSALYRGVVKLFYFKYLWKTGKFLQFGDEKFCSMKVSFLADRIGRLESYTVSMVRDVARGFPKSSKEFQEQISRFDRDFKLAKAWLKGQKEASLSIKEVTEQYAEKQSIAGFRCEF